MTSPASDRFASKPRRRPSGFTLVELLVVLGIVMLLISLIIGITVIAQKKASDTRTRADMLAISMALDQYKADFRSYPMRARATDPLILAWALIGPGPAQQDGFSDVPVSAANPNGDGPGFRTVAGGKIYPSYLSLQSLKAVRIGRRATTAGTFTFEWELRDNRDRPIEYYPKRRDAGVDGNGLLVGNTFVPNAIYRFESTDGTLAIDVLEWHLGDRNGNHTITRAPQGNQPAETLQATGDYVLLAPGEDELFSKPATDAPSDDVLYDPSAR